MGYDISWTLRRDRQLDADERAALAEHVERNQSIVGYDLMVRAGDEAPPDGLVGWYVLRPSYGDPERSDGGGYISEIVDEVLSALSDLRTLVPGATLHVEDDFGVWFDPDGDGWDHRDFEDDDPEHPDRGGGWVPVGKR